MRNFLIATLAAGAVLLGVVAVGGCDSAKPVIESRARAAKRTSVKPQFGPMYPARGATDPLVAKTLRGADTTGTPVVGAEITGYLVDWVIHETSDTVEIREFGVLKNGNLYWPLSGGVAPRPSAAFGTPAPARLGPEPAEEAKAREAALAAAQRAIGEFDPNFRSVRPVIYNYLVRIHRTDGSHVDVWVDPDVGNGRFFYGIKLRKI